MQNPLDNPVWHARMGPHAHVAIGRCRARQYSRGIAPFSAIADASAKAYADLAADLPASIEARLFRPIDVTTPAGWETVGSRPIIQMVADCKFPAASGLRWRPVELHLDDVHDMLEMAAVAKPGPFVARTLDLGTYLGYRERGRLLAMGGERMRLPGSVELSGICVHPAVRGRGLGAAITMQLALSAMARGETPFLHVFPNNPAAALYDRLGFRERARLWVIWRRVRCAGL
jgi:ribosomal protein S18 acetylase RimI-like enzyme